jgi:hypothetical protein
VRGYLKALQKLSAFALFTPSKIRPCAVQIHDKHWDKHHPVIYSISKTFRLCPKGKADEADAAKTTAPPHKVKTSNLGFWKRDRPVRAAFAIHNKPVGTAFKRQSDTAKWLDMKAGKSQ